MKNRPPRGCGFHHFGKFRGSFAGRAHGTRRSGAPGADHRKKPPTMPFITTGDVQAAIIPKRAVFVFSLPYLRLNGVAGPKKHAAP